LNLLHPLAKKPRKYRPSHILALPLMYQLAKAPHSELDIKKSNYTDRAILHRQLKADDAEAFERYAVDLLRGDLLKLKVWHP
jgi:hypothetical protein